MYDAEPCIKTKLAEARTNLGVSLEVMATILALGPQGAEKVLAWEEGTKEIPEKVKIKICNLPSTFLGKPNHTKPKFTFIDLFAGIGGIRIPFQDAGGKCVFTSEWDKHSQTTYAVNFGDTPRRGGDIKAFTAKEIPTHDVLLAGFPCQAFSQAGKRQGFLDTRGTMFFEIQRILAEKKPAAFLLENVKQLKGHDEGRTLKTIIAILRGENVPEIPADIPMSNEARKSLETRLNYDVDFQVLRARDFGVPQNRERVYIVGFKRPQENSKPNHERVASMFQRVTAKHKKVSTLDDILMADSEYTRGFTISDTLWKGHKDRKARNKAAGKGFGYSKFKRTDGYSNTLSARYYKDGSEILIDQDHLELNPRKLTPEEARALQGFPNDFIVNFVSHTQAYRQFGNSVAIPVIRAIATEMLPEIKIGLQKAPKK